MWRFAESLGDRLDQLENPPTTDVIATSIAQAVRVDCRHERQADDHGDFYRAAYCITVGRSLFDLFSMLKLAIEAHSSSRRTRG
jgi:hypothetical protein